MKIIVAPDSFKGSLTAEKFCEVCERTLKELLPDAEVISMPLADGGEGSAECFKRAVNCKSADFYVQNALFEEIDAPILFYDDGKTALIETAKVNGLPQVKGRDNPEETSTYGIGQLIGHAVDLGAKKIILALGGSSTNDCGLGMLAALGACFYNKDGVSFVPTGGTLCEVADIDLSMMYPRLVGARFEAMCDVENPLCGENGCSRVFAPQKGADIEMVERLEKGCQHIAGLFNLMRDKDCSLEKGAGAAGGLGFAVLAGLFGELKKGIDVFLNLYDFEKELADCDFLITGEGSFDKQSLMGKAVGGVIGKANNINRNSQSSQSSLPVYVFCGKSKVDFDLPENVKVIPISEDQPLDYALAHAEENLEKKIKIQFAND